MQNNVIDLIIYMARRMHIGIRLQDIELENLKEYDKAEISAAYSWLLQKYETGEAGKKRLRENRIPPPRTLHPGEQNQISTEAQGYLIELYYLGIVDAGRMERLIEYAMLRMESGRVEVSDIKSWVTGMIFEVDQPRTDHSSYLKGDETIN